jgi:hypothetical protein
MLRRNVDNRLPNDAVSNPTRTETNETYLYEVLKKKTGQNILFPMFSCIKNIQHTLYNVTTQQ